MLRPRLLVSVATSLALMLGAAACGTGGSGEAPEQDFTKKLQLGTGSVGGTYYPLGGEMASILSKKADIKGFAVSPVETGASIENMGKVGTGKLQLGLTVNGTARDAFQGKGEFKGHKIQNFGFISQIYPEVYQAVTLEGSGIDSLADLKGKKVAIGPPGGGTNAINRKVLAAYGIQDGDYKAFAEGFDVAAKKLRDGNVDASLTLLGAPASGIDQLEATTHKVKFLDIKGSALEKVVGSTVYSKYTIPKGTYDWLDRDVPTITTRSILVASTNQVSKKVGYAVTKALLENADQITNQQGKNITLDNALNGRLNLPLHPGAKKYYKEKDLLGK